MSKGINKKNEIKLRLYLIAQGRPMPEPKPEKKKP